MKGFGVRKLRKVIDSVQGLQEDGVLACQRGQQQVEARHTPFISRIPYDSQIWRWISIGITMAERSEVPQSGREAFLLQKWSVFREVLADWEIWHRRSGISQEIRGVAPPVLSYSAPAFFLGPISLNGILANPASSLYTDESSFNRKSIFAASTNPGSRCVMKFSPTSHCAYLATRRKVSS